MTQAMNIDPVAVRDGVLKHCESLRVDDGPYGVYRFSPTCKPTYWASGFIALARYLWGDLDTLTDQQRQEWIDYLANGQDEETGLYIDPVFKSEERKSSSHTDELLFWHSSTFIMTALDLLGGKLNYPVHAVDRLKTPEGMKQFIEDLPWKMNPWVCGNWTYDIGCLVGHDWLVTQAGTNLEAMDWFFQWMEENQNKETGWWDIVGGHPITHQQFGGYHTLMVYWMFDREVPNPELMIDSSLTIQDDEGKFLGGCCPNMDCADAIVSLSRQYNIRQEEARKSMQRLLPFELSMQDPKTGGFLDYDLNYSGNVGGRNEFGWLQCSAPEGAPDPCSNQFRGFTLSLISEVVPDTGLEKIPWRHHGSFGHAVRPKSLMADPEEHRAPKR